MLKLIKKEKKQQKRSLESKLKGKKANRIYNKKKADCRQVAWHLRWETHCNEGKKNKLTSVGQC